MSREVNNQNSTFYAIRNFNTERGAGMGGYGFSVDLRADVVAALLETKRDENAPLNVMLELRIQNSLRSNYPPTFHFYNDTWFLRSMTIDVQCACVGIDGSRLSKGERA